MYVGWWECESERESNSGLIVHHQNHQVITSAHAPFYFNYRHKVWYLYMCVSVCVCAWTEMECEWCSVMGLNRIERCG